MSHPLKQRLFLVLLSIGTLLLVSPSVFAQKPAKTPANTTRIYPPPSVAKPGEKVKTFDLNKDKRPDLWKVYKNGALIREEQDLNFDNRIDIRRYFKGKDKFKDIFDLDYDGKIDLINYYFKGRMYKQELFMKSKTRPDVFKYYEMIGKKRKKKLMLVRKERDTNLDGKIDYWEYWEKGELNRILRDTDYDGKVDTQEKIGGN